MRLEATKPEFSNSITDTLKEFLENEHKNTLMLKGQWGTGKTFAVRNFFEKGPGRDCRTYSYFSLAGQKILPDERSLVFSGLERIGGTPLDGKLRDVLKGLPKGLRSIPWFGVVSEVGGALAPAFAGLSLKGAIIVIDDIERKDPDLKLDTVFGVISRLAEVRQSKVIAIMNDEELKEKEDLARKREKVFDQEFDFYPAVDESLQLVGVARESAVGGAARALGINNLRVLQKVSWAVRDVCSELKAAAPELEQEVTERVENQTALIASMWYRAKVPLTKALLENVFSLYMVERHDPEKARENPFYEDLKACNFFGSPVDDVVLEFLNKGRSDESALKEAAQKLSGEHHHREYEAMTEKFLNGLRSRFGSLNEDEIDAAQRVTNEYLIYLQPGETSYWAEVLDLCGIRCDLAELEREWAAITPFTTGEAVMKLSDETAKRILSQRVTETETADNPKSFEDMLSKGRLAGSLLDRDETKNVNWLKEHLRSASNPQLMNNLDKIFSQLERIADGSESTYEGFRAALFEAVQQLSNENPVDKFRLRNVITRHSAWLTSPSRANQAVN